MESIDINDEPLYQPFAESTKKCLRDLDESFTRSTPVEGQIVANNGQQESQNDDEPLYDDRGYEQNIDNLTTLLSELWYDRVPVKGRKFVGVLPNLKQHDEKES